MEQTEELHHARRPLVERGLRNDRVGWLACPHRAERLGIVVRHGHGAAGLIDPAMTIICIPGLASDLDPRRRNVRASCYIENAGQIFVAPDVELAAQHACKAHRERGVRGFRADVPAAARKDRLAASGSQRVALRALEGQRVKGFRVDVHVDRVATRAGRGVREDDAVAALRKPVRRRAVLEPVGLIRPVVVPACARPGEGPGHADQRKTAGDDEQRSFQ